MTLFSILETFFIGPLKLLFEIIFRFAYDLVQTPGLAIIFLSLAMNILVLPLYRRADAMQEQARDTEAKLHDGVAHIKKTFSGNERMMMLQAYYRQNNYSPTNALRGSVSLLLEIPFFMAAYQFLSHLSILQGVSFGPIADLGAPDGLLRIGGVTINLLPVLMTGINFISSAIYLRGFPLKTKIQLYAMALFFLWFLYTSPSGLVFYWTLNNVFSLGKNIFYKLKNPKKVLTCITTLLGLGLIVLYLGARPLGLPQLRRLIVLGLGIALELPLVLALVKSLGRKKRASSPPAAQPDRKLFLGAGLFLTLLVGLLIPSNYIAASPQEYMDATHFFHPLWYVLKSLCMAGGFFLLWLGVFYWLASPRGKVLFERVLWAACGMALVNYMFFGTRLGNLSATLEYDEGFVFSATERLLNAAAMLVTAALMWLLAVKWKKLPKTVLLVAVIAIGLMSGYYVYNTKRAVDHVQVQSSEDVPEFRLSRSGKNVVVLFLDRAMGEFMPYILNEKPELKQTYDGFTLYSNVISYGGHTNMGSPPLLGGYEYTPVEMNRRPDEPLVEKHNEALKVMPALFWQNGYEVTVCDPPYANYRWIPDLSIFDEYEGMKTYVTKGFFTNAEQKEQVIENNLRNFFCFSLMKVSPIEVQRRLYSEGTYLQVEAPTQTEEDSSAKQEVSSKSVADGYNSNFMVPYEVLTNLDTMTKFTDEETNTYLFFYNDAPHYPQMLQEPEYLPALHVDNTEYDETHKDRFTLEGRSLKMTTKSRLMHYQSNVCVLQAVGKWLDLLREQGVYDNTRIIIVADHGFYLYACPELDFREENVREVDGTSFYPLLMVKDFDAKGFTVNDQFMTNADTPTLAFEGLIENPTNPFTGKPINSDEKTAHDQFIMTNAEWSTQVNNGNQFLPATWVALTNNIWDREDWVFIDERLVLTENEIPEAWKK